MLRLVSKLQSRTGAPVSLPATEIPHRPLLQPKIESSRRSTSSTCVLLSFAESRTSSCFQGGDYTKIQDTAEWIGSTDKSEFWRAIEVAEVVPVVDMLPNEVRLEVKQLLKPLLGKYVSAPACCFLRTKEISLGGSALRRSTVLRSCQSPYTGPRIRFPQDGSGSDRVRTAARRSSSSRHLGTRPVATLHSLERTPARGCPTSPSSTFPNTSSSRLTLVDLSTTPHLAPCFAA